MSTHFDLNDSAFRHATGESRVYNTWSSITIILEHRSYALFGCNIYRFAFSATANYEIHSLISSTNPEDFSSTCKPRDELRRIGLSFLP